MSHFHDLPPLPCYLNGDYTLLPDAKISVMDRGFIFGDGVYEVVPVYAGKPFRFEQHMARLDRSLKELRIPNPLDLVGWRAMVSKLIANYQAYTGASALFDPQDSSQLVYIQITRGVAMRDHVMPQNITPTLFAMSNVMKAHSAQQRATGVTCVSADDFRWAKAHIKSVSLLGAVFSRQISFDAGALETVMYRDGYLSEAASSNVWVVKNNTLIGVPKDNLVLEGIRFGLFEELCRDAGLAFELRRITRAEVLDADELLLSSATKEVLSITTLDGNPVGHGATLGKPGPVYAKLYAQYQLAKARAAAEAF
jgi:D-alanine transaminase